MTVEAPVGTEKCEGSNEYANWVGTHWTCGVCRNFVYVYVRHPDEDNQERAAVHFRRGRDSQ